MVLYRIYSFYTQNYLVKFDGLKLKLNEDLIDCCRFPCVDLESPLLKIEIDLA